MNHELQLATCNTFFMFFLFVCWLPLDGMLSHSHTVLVVCLISSEVRNVTITGENGTIDGPGDLGSFDTQNARSGGEKWRVGHHFLCHLIWAVVDEGDIFQQIPREFSDFLMSFGGKVHVKHGGKCKSNMVASRQSFWILESCGVGCDYTKEVSRWFGNRLYSGHIPSITYCIISHLEAGWPLKSYHPKRRIVFQASFFSYVGYLKKNQAGIPLVDFGCPTAAQI